MFRVCLELKWKLWVLKKFFVGVGYGLLLLLFGVGVDEVLKCLIIMLGDCENCIYKLGMVKVSMS